MLLINWRKHSQRPFSILFSTIIATAVMCENSRMLNQKLQSHSESYLPHPVIPREKHEDLSQVYQKLSLTVIIPTKWNLSHNLAKLPPLKFCIIHNFSLWSKVLLLQKSSYVHQDFITLWNWAMHLLYTGMHHDSGLAVPAHLNVKWRIASQSVSIADIQYIPPKYSCIFILHSFICTCKGEREVGWK